MVQYTFYNTKARKKEAFSREAGSAVSIYVCGPTVYGPAHIGNARPAVVFDVLRNVLSEKWRVIYVSNFTDIDDKIIAAAAKEGCLPAEIAKKYEAVYISDMARLGVRAPDQTLRATETMDEIKTMIGALIEGGYAYEAEGHVLFSVERYDGYGDLSHRTLSQMEAGARVEVAPYKRNPFDFVLWKPASGQAASGQPASGQIGWESPWGLGRPGWHIECSAMIHKAFGSGVDIHAAGGDLIFPHHENERAQSNCVHGGELAEVWMHNGMVVMGADKMSKSQGNVLLLQDLLQKYDGRVLRMALLMTHYRQPLHWTERLLEEAQSILGKLYQAYEAGEVAAAAPDPEFLALLGDDLNTPAAIGFLSRTAKKISHAGGTASADERPQLMATLRQGLELLGITEHPETDDIKIKQITNLFANYKKMRAQKNYPEADKIRAEIIALGGKLQTDKEGKTRLSYGLTSRPIQ